jgi:hypothetical protein
MASPAPAPPVVAPPKDELSPLSAEINEAMNTIRDSVRVMTFNILNNTPLVTAYQKKVTDNLTKIYEKKDQLANLSQFESLLLKYNAADVSSNMESVMGHYRKQPADIQSQAEVNWMLVNLPAVKTGMESVQKKAEDAKAAAEVKATEAQSGAPQSGGRRRTRKTRKTRRRRSGHHKQR